MKHNIFKKNTSTKNRSSKLINRYLKGYTLYIMTLFMQWRKKCNLPVALTTIYIFLSLFIPNNKLLFFSATIYFLLLFFSQRSIYKTILYAFFPFSITLSGLTYSFYIIPPTSTPSIFPQLINGRPINYIFSPLSILYIINIVYLLYIFLKSSFLKEKIYKFYNTLIIFTLLYILFCIISSFYSKVQPTFSMLFSLNEFGTVSWTLLFFLFKDDKKYTVIKTTIYIIVLITVIESSIILMQFFLQQPLGFLFENQNALSFGTSDDLSLYRPTGFRNFSGYTAYIYIDYICVFIFSLLIFHSKKIKNISIIGLLSSILIIILTRTRSVYISLALLSLIIVSNYYQKIIAPIIQFIKKNLSNHKTLFIPGIFLTSLCTIILIIRTIYSINTFTKSGSFYGRFKLEKLAIELIKRNPFLGVGTEMSVPASYQLNPSSYLLEFPSVVHNVFLQILAENGIIALLCYCLIYIQYFILVWKNKISWKIKNLIIFSLINSCYLMFFNPIKIFSPLTLLLFFVFSNTKKIYDT